MGNSIKVTHKDIAEYWINKGIKRNGEIVDNVDLSSLQNIHTVFPLNSPVPCCWACGLQTKRDVTDATSILDAYRYATDLNRCHIKARQFGGPDEASNLFLMCELCHADSPDTTNQEAFFRWVYDRKEEYFNGYRVKGLIIDVKRELERRGYSFNGVNKAFNDLFTEEERAYYVSMMKDAFVEKLGLHGMSISRSTVSVAATDTILEFAFDKLIEVAFNKEVIE